MRTEPKYGLIVTLGYLGVVIAELISDKTGFKPGTHIHGILEYSSSL